MRILLPGPGRIALALLTAVPAGMAYPWSASHQRWALGIAVVVVLSLAGWWRGLHVTTILRRRMELKFRGGRAGAHDLAEQVSADARTTVVLRILDGTSVDVPLDLVAGYLDRYGVRCDSVRVTSRDTETGRTTWIGMTLSVVSNIIALQARSVTIPLRETADITLRRLADELRELGFTLTASIGDIPDPLGPQAKERWRAVADGGSGHIAVYSIPAESLSATLNELWSRRFAELWTAIEFSAGGVAAACAIRTEDAPAVSPPVSGLASCRGRQWQALRALVPTSMTPLEAEVHPIGEVPLVWPANSVALSA